MSLKITRLNTKAEGVAEGHAPFERVLPGEIVDADGRIEMPSPDRVKALCRHYKSCGGCAMQHASEAFVANWKTDVIRTGLAARGIETEIRPILTSPPQSRRRATLHGKRTKSGAMIGFFAPGSDTLIETPDCQLLHPAIMAAWEMLEALTVFGASRKGVIGLEVTVTDNGLDLNVTGGKPLAAPDLAKAAAMARSFGLARLSWDGDAGASRLPAVQQFGRARVQPPPGAFLQPTIEGQAHLQEAVATIIGGAKQVVDLFAGCGTFSLPAAQSAEIWALEGDAALTQALDQGWRQAEGLKRVKAETRDLFRRPVLAEELRKSDAVIIDPPRAGAEAQTQELARSEIKTIAAISCNPVTFARDAELLISGGYRLNWVQPVDQFRWSAHVELAASFTKGHITA